MEVLLAVHFHICIDTGWFLPLYFAQNISTKVHEDSYVNLDRQQRLKRIQTLVVEEFTISYETQHMSHNNYKFAELQNVLFSSS